MNNLTIQYKGKVTVKYEKNGKILKSYQVHNNGTQELFRYLCACLTNNQQNNVNNCPEYIMLYNLTEGQTLSETNLGTPVLNAPNFKAKVEVIYEDAIYKTKFRFMIPTNSLLDSANVIAIYSANNRETATQITTKPSAYTKLLDAAGTPFIINSNVMSSNIILE